MASSQASLLTTSGPGEIDVCIVAYRSRDTIGACLDAALALVPPDQVTVVDHGADGAADVAQRQGVRVVRKPANPGFGAGQNEALRHGTAPYVLLLNPDAIVVASALADGKEILASQADVGCVEGAILRIDGLPERSAGRAVAPVHLIGRALALRGLLRFSIVRWVAGRLPALADHAERIQSRPRDVESLAATVLLARRSALESVGGFDEGYFLYGEDLDLCMRLRRAGWRLVAMPAVWARHLGGASSSSSRSREVQWWRGTMRYAALWFGTWSFVVAQAAAAVRWARLGGREAWHDMVRLPITERSRARGRNHR